MPTLKGSAPPIIGRTNTYHVLMAVAANVSANNAVAFGAMNDQFPRAKSNGATTIILFKRWSVVVCRVM
jgi:hypothetical protein